MGGKHPRVIGTTIEAIEKAEKDLGFLLSPSHRDWLLSNNGKYLEDITIFPVFDERDPRKTWDSIVRNFNENWQSWVSNFGAAYNFSHLLPFGEFGTGDYFCFDFSSVGLNSEAVVVRWSHETGETEHIAKNFAEFVLKVEAGVLNY